MKRLRDEVELLRQRVTKLEYKLEKLANYLGVFWKTEPDEILPRWEKFRNTRGEEV